MRTKALGATIGLVLTAGVAAATIVGATHSASASAPATTVPVVCVGVPTSTGGSTTPVGYCPPGTKPTPVPVGVPRSACVALPLSAGGKPVHAGYCPS